MARTGLGKGLGALIGTPSVSTRPDSIESGERVHQSNLANIVPSAIQPRKDLGRAAVANALRLLDLHPHVQVWLAQDLLSVGHAKVVLALKAPEEQLLAAETVLRRNATVRATERLVARLLGVGRSHRKSRRAGSEPSMMPTALEDLQNRLHEHLATHVTIHHGDKRGRIEIEYYGNDDLQRIVTALGLAGQE